MYQGDFLECTVRTSPHSHLLGSVIVLLYVSTSTTVKEPNVIRACTVSWLAASHPLRQVDFYDYYTLTWSEEREGESSGPRINSRWRGRGRGFNPFLSTYLIQIKFNGGQAAFKTCTFPNEKFQVKKVKLDVCETVSAQILTVGTGKEIRQKRVRSSILKRERKKRLVKKGIAK